MNSKLTIGKKIGGLCAVLVVLTVVTGGIAEYSFRGIDQNIQSIAVDSLPGVASISALEGDFQAFRGNAWKHISTTDPANLQAVERRIDELKRSMEVGLVEYERTIRQPEDRVLFAKLRPALDRYAQAWNAVVPLSREMKKSEASERYMAEADPLFMSARAVLVDLVDWNRKSGQRNAAGATSASDTARVLSRTVLLLCVLLGGLLSFLIIRSINRELGREVSELRSSAEQVASAAIQVSSSGQSLSQGTSEQAASLEETSATTEQINAMAQRNTQGAKSVVEIVTNSKRKFSETTDALDSMVQAMSEIGTSSEKIGRIIKTIDEIAFQTNILALNAAVEAARAGEAGMGFAVVADEVRNLAQRCAHAAKETATLIEESIANAADGKSKVDHVAVLVRHLAAESASINTLVEDVSLGSQEQASGIDQITRTVQAMQTVTQRSAATAEESAAAAEELASQADALRNVVGRLRSLVSGGCEDADQQLQDGSVDFDAAIRVHAAWKEKLATYLRNPDGSIDAMTLAKADHCALGKWILCQKGESSSNPIFIELKQEHANFHRAAADIARRANSGERLSADAVLGASSSYAHSSGRVVQLLSSLKKTLVC